MPFLSPTEWAVRCQRSACCQVLELQCRQNWPLKEAMEKCSGELSQWLLRKKISKTHSGKYKMFVHCRRDLRVQCLSYPWEWLCLTPAIIFNLLCQTNQTLIWDPRHTFFTKKLEITLNHSWLDWHPIIGHNLLSMLIQHLFSHQVAWAHLNSKDGWPAPSSHSHHSRSRTRLLAFIVSRPDLTIK